MEPKSWKRHNSEKMPGGYVGDGGARNNLEVEVRVHHPSEGETGSTVVVEE